MFLRNNIIASLFTLALLFVSSYAKAQTDFREGYVIKSVGDTLHGKIDYRRSVRMAKVCVFRSDTGDETSYKPEDILGYRFKEDKYFVSKKINEKSYFLEFLIEGKLCVYYMEDEKGSHYFMNREGEKVIEIPYREEIKYIDNKKMVYRTTTHIGALRYCVQDAPKLLTRVNTFKKLEHRQLIRLAKDYHQTVCKDTSSIVYEKSTKLIHASFDFVSGVMKYGSNEYIDTEIRNSSFFQKGFMIHFWTNRKNEKTFVRLGLLHNSGETRLQPYYIPFQIGYMAPRTFRVRPMVAVGLIFPTYSAGVMIKLHKKAHLGVQSWLRFFPSAPLLLIPKAYHSFSVTGNLLIDLF